jgi:hypothetical protein
MAQHDYVIDNQTAPNFRADLNSALAAIVSTNSGSSAPSTTYANMMWYDTTANILKMRNEADDTWINVGYLDQSANAFRILDNTQVTTTAGSQTGLLGDQATATWESGTDTTESLVSPAKVKAAIEALALSVGVQQTWQAPSRAANTTYTNSTGRPIQVLINANTQSIGSFLINGASVGNFRTGESEWAWIFAIIPNGNTYSANFGGISFWRELR